MQVMTPSLLAGVALVLAFAPSAHAQYFHEGPQKPEVEIDLSVLNDPTQSPTDSYIAAPAYAPPPAPAHGGYDSSGEYPAPITAPVPPAHVEQAPLPPMLSPYENTRVIDRVELEGANPYVGHSPPSPFNPPALIKPPKPRTESPRTVPATVFKPSTPAPFDGGVPVVIEAEPEQGVEMPPIVVTQDVIESKKRTAGTARKIMRVQKPVRKPDVLSLASEDIRAAETESAAMQPLLPAPVAPETPAPVTELSPLEQQAEPATAVPTAVPDAPAASLAATTPMAPVDVIDGDALDFQPPPIEQITIEEQPAAAVEAALPEVQKTAEMVIDDLYTLPAINEVAPPREVDVVPANAITQTIAFQDGSAALDTAMITEIDAIAKKLEGSTASRLLIKGYASGTGGDRAAARRLSVSRALAVRSHLMDKGIKPSRVDVRGLGIEGDTAAEATQADRVELVLIPG